MIQKKRLVSLTQKVLGFNSENPPGNEKKLADFIVRYLKILKPPVKTYTFAKGRPNIVAVLRGSLPRAQAAREALLFTPHFDTVPIGTGWKFDPLGKDIVKGRIYGRGASDDKGNLACSLEVFESLVESGYKPRKDIILAATVDEETGSRFGIVPLLEQKILKPKCALILDSDEFDVIIAQKGLLHSRVQIFGKKSHGAYNWRGVNAIEQAALVIKKLKDVDFAFNPHSLLRPPTMNIGTIRGGDKVNMVADFCEFTVDIRFLPGMDPRAILRIIRKEVQSVTKKFKLIVDDLQQPYEIDRNNLFVRTYAQTAKQFKISPTFKGSEGATVITFFQKYKISAFATGFGAKGTAHTTDEYAKIDTLYQGAQVLEKFIKDYDAL